MALKHPRKPRAKVDVLPTKGSKWVAPTESKLAAAQNAAAQTGTPIPLVLAKPVKPVKPTKSGKPRKPSKAQPPKAPVFSTKGSKFTASSASAIALAQNAAVLAGTAIPIQPLHPVKKAKVVRVAKGRQPVQKAQHVASSSAPARAAGGGRKATVAAQAVQHLPSQRPVRLNRPQPAFPLPKKPTRAKKRKMLGV